MLLTNLITTTITIIIVGQENIISKMHLVKTITTLTKALLTTKLIVNINQMHLTTAAITIIIMLVVDSHPQITITNNQMVTKLSSQATDILLQDLVPLLILII